MRRGEVYWFDFGARAKKRPVVVLTGTRSLPHLSTATVAAITTTVRGTRSEVALSEEDGLPRSCVINLHQVHTVEQSHLRARLTQLSDDVLRRVEFAVAFSFGFGQHDAES